MYLLVSGSTALFGDCYIKCSTFSTPTNATMSMINMDTNNPIKSGSVTNIPSTHQSVWYKQCKAGETHAFTWSIDRWNRRGDIEVSLIRIGD